MRLLMRCPACGKYTLEEKCACGGKIVTAHPMKYSPEDKYAKYRRKEKYGLVAKNEK